MKKRERLIKKKSVRFEREVHKTRTYMLGVHCRATIVSAIIALKEGPDAQPERKIWELARWYSDASYSRKGYANRSLGALLTVLGSYA